jgi:hypothetical protein
MVQKTGAYAPCAWLGVSAQIAGAKGASPSGTRLRVWGGGIDESISLADSKYVFLTSSPRPTHGYYFARLEDEKGVPISSASSFDTYANDGPNRCSKNLITLVFAPMAAAPGSATGSSN